MSRLSDFLATRNWRCFLGLHVWIEETVAFTDRVYKVRRCRNCRRMDIN